MSQEVSTTEVILEGQIDPRKIYFLRFLLEAHGHIGILSTLSQGRIIIHTSEGCLGQVLQLLDEISSKIRLRQLKIIPSSK